MSICATGRGLFRDRLAADFGPNTPGGYLGAHARTKMSPGGYPVQPRRAPRGSTTGGQYAVWAIPGRSDGGTSDPCTQWTDLARFDERGGGIGASGPSSTPHYKKRRHTEAWMRESD
jgi:hypothetical protein